MIKADKVKQSRLAHGDIIKDVEYIEYITEEKGNIEVSKIIFPLVIILTQDCDLAQDYTFRLPESKKKTQDKHLLSTLVAPIYNLEHVYLGQHLSELDLLMAEISRKGTSGERLLQNETARYHYLEFPKEIPIAPSVIDFKHYFSVNVLYLRKIKEENFICRVTELYREDIAQRFSSFLSRIALPD